MGTKRSVSRPLTWFISLCLVFGIWHLANNRLSVMISQIYNPAFGNILNDQKNIGVALQRVALERGDSIPLYGTSDLTNTNNPFHPVNFFANRGGIHVNLIGQGYYQSLMQLMNYGSMGNTLKGKKIALIISPQWFTEHGLTNKNFDMNFSEQHFLSLMFDPNISQSIKTYVAQRVRIMVEGCPEAPEVQRYCDLYTSDKPYSKVALFILTPYYKIRLELLNTKDLVKSYNTLSKTKYKAKTAQEPFIPKTAINWEAERLAANKTGKENAKNNEYYMDSRYFERYIKNKYKDYKGYMNGLSYCKSPEYDDFRFLLQLCKDLGIQPLFISIPVNGKWYDYCSFSKTDRQQYYKNIKEMVTSYGFQLADFSSHEYDAYFLQDHMHIGWKGWVYVNEALVSYFN
ncbi:MAG: D-alanyl-lipoteichoic acid biosynthesis protein DltD [Peptococcaceae bacterium]|nr:D-alanyl-lipoteichoic acid biosynthesis protein DltD [Peptococcaceae bacterium]